MEDGLTLNGGCGPDKFGDIRVDVKDWSVAGGSQKTAANLVASVEYLPFRDKVFSHARCFHTLEHCRNPGLALSELFRVSNELHLKYPIQNRYSQLIEIITLLRYIIFMFTKTPRYFHSVLSQLGEIGRWNERYGDHKWYISIKGQKTNRKYGIPHEYEVRVIDSETSVRFTPI